MLDLNKTIERKNIALDLVKDAVGTDITASVVLALDYSGSMYSLYHNGHVQEVLERLLPLGLAFDDNREVDFFLFDDHYDELPEPLTMQNTNDYVKTKILGKYNMGGTNYAPVINAIVDKYTVKKTTTTTTSKGGLFGLFSNTQETETLERVALSTPVYVIFITDGANADKKETKEALIEASKYGIFFQFVGIGDTTFEFLEKLDDLKGRVIDNANFFAVPDLNKTEDKGLYKLLFTEFPSWYKQALKDGILVKP